jgi:hypothetical protein
LIFGIEFLRMEYAEKNQEEPLHELIRIDIVIDIETIDKCPGCRRWSAEGVKQGFNMIVIPLESNLYVPGSVLDLYIRRIENAGGCEIMPRRLAMALPFRGNIRITCHQAVVLPS